jgi:eukaryotic-like serine/threonine-protein kinase
VTNSGDATVINDRYEVHKRIGRGGMADVFSARDLLLDRQVAIKVLFPEFATDENFVERFRREAQSAANLSHPNIVNVYDWGKYEGTYFIAMEEVQGRTLADVLKSNRQLTSKQAAEIASEVAAALGFAHEKGVAHRDIKPANILIGSNGQVKVADFGIARAMNAPTEANLTQVGSVMGTATYFSPEQAQGAQPDPRSDLYSLGIVMYEMVAGRAPFTGDNPVSIAYKQVHDAPQPLVQIVADVPKPYEAMVAKLLAKDPKLRYPSAGALRDDLRRFRNDEPVQALVAAVTAQARPSGVGAGGVAATGAIPTAAAATAMNRAVTGATAPTGVNPIQPQAARVPSTGMYEAGYPTGSSAEAAYYDTGGSRTGWYALAAFFALIALVVGAFLLYQALSGPEEQSEPSQFVLADYSNRSRADVVAELTELDLLFRTIAEPNPNVQVDFVHRTEPAAGEVVLATQEILVFFNPDEQLSPIPQVVGMPLSEARLRIESDGFSVGVVTTETTDTRAENTVLGSTPEAGVQARAGTEIDLVVAAPPDSLQVPGIVVNRTQAQALELLENEPYNFVVTVENINSEVIPAGQVISVNPAGGELVPKGGAVTITVSSGPAPVIVPPVEGLTAGQATNQLRGAGLEVVVEFREVAPGNPDDGRVIDQTPDASTQVPRGTTITLIVGRSLVAATTVPPTAPPTTEPPPTTAPVTTAPVTTAPATTAPATTAAPTTAAPTTAAPTTAPPPDTTIP